MGNMSESAAAPPSLLEEVRLHNTEEGHCGALMRTISQPAEMRSPKNGDKEKRRKRCRADVERRRV